MKRTQTDDVRIAGLTPLIPPRKLKEDLPLSERSIETVLQGRVEIESVLQGKDDRLVVIVGPCSIHDPDSALEYATRLVKLREELSERLAIIMRVYFEKPRTKLGWRGHILDPNLDGSYDIGRGLESARRLLLQITEMGLPAGSEVLDPIVPQYTAELLSWAGIGARTTESQTHREMASGLSMPVGFKNGTDGSVMVAVNAMASSTRPHRFIGIDQEGRTCMLETRGNEFSHLILRGGRSGPNYHDEDVEDALDALTENGLNRAVMVDCSHGNSRKNHGRQCTVLKSVLRQRGEGNRAVIGAMIESNLQEGAQKLTSPSELAYGVSITDACIGWEETECLLRCAADLEAARARGSAELLGGCR